MKILAAPRRALNKGFTLIELLVVIGILGILAAALVATIDPFEQLQKANDSKIKNMAVEFLNANIRYYTNQTAFPWNNSDAAYQVDHPDCVGAPLDAAFTGEDLSTTPMIDCLDVLADNGELKASFTTNTNDLEKVLVTWDPTDATDVVVCFAPVSKSGKGAKDAIYTAADGVAVDPNICPDPDAADGTCFWCTR